MRSSRAGGAGAAGGAAGGATGAAGGVDFLRLRAGGGGGVALGSVGGLSAGGGVGAGAGGGGGMNVRMTCGAAGAGEVWKVHPACRAAWATCCSVWVNMSAPARVAGFNGMQTAAANMGALAARAQRRTAKRGRGIIARWMVGGLVGGIRCARRRSCGWCRAWRR
jgi:hypothetical protein